MSLVKQQVLKTSRNPAIFNNQILLERTHHITEDDNGLYEWDYIKSLYDHPDSNTPWQTVCTILNSIITQRRVVFTMTRDSVSRMVKADKNHKSAVFNDRKWSLILSKMYEMGFIKLVEQGQGRKASAYELIDEDLLEVLGVDRDEQLQQTLDFIHNRQADTASDTDIDTDIDTKRLRDEQTKSLRVSSEEIKNLETNTAATTVSLVKPSLPIKQHMTARNDETKERKIALKERKVESDELNLQKRYKVLKSLWNTSAERRDDAFHVQLLEKHKAEMKGLLDTAVAAGWVKPEFRSKEFQKYEICS